MIISSSTIIQQNNKKELNSFYFKNITIVMIIYCGTMLSSMLTVLWITASPSDIWISDTN